VFGGLRTKNIYKRSEKDKPLVTVITVVRNSVKTLEGTIFSVINQSYDNIEFIVIDCVSIDGTLDIIKRYDDNIDYWISEPDDGIYDAMNKGISFASGEIIGILNSDDWYELDACEKIVSKYLSSSVDVVFGNMLMFFPDGLYNLVTVSIPKKKETFSVSYVHPTVFVKSIVYSQYGIFNKKYKIAADYDLLLRFFEQGIRFAKVDSVITNFRTGGASTNTSIYNEILQIAVDHHFSIVGIIRRFMLFCYAKISIPLKIIFPFFPILKRKFIKMRQI
jgi:glycosyltransferase involved in cell wall biosynthesis